MRLKQPVLFRYLEHEYFRLIVPRVPVCSYYMEQSKTLASR